jgi:hypothetical protein
MSPELERLLWARWRRDQARPEDRAAADAEYGRQLEQALHEVPHGAGRDLLLAALDSRFLEFRRQRRREMIARLPGRA